MKTQIDVQIHEKPVPPELLYTGNISSWPVGVYAAASGAYFRVVKMPNGVYVQKSSYTKKWEQINTDTLLFSKYRKLNNSTATVTITTKEEI